MGPGPSSAFTFFLSATTFAHCSLLSSLLRMVLLECGLASSPVILFSHLLHPTVGPSET